MKRLLALFFCFAITTGCGAQPQQETEEVQASEEEQKQTSQLVLTSVAPIYQLVSALTAGTTIEVANIPERARSMGSQPTFFLRQSDELAEQFKQAEAAIGISRVWLQDPLYQFARQANIRIVNVDAALPWSHERSGVALTRSEESSEISPYFWTGPANVIRMAEIVAYDLKALFPDQEAGIDTNLQAFKNELLDIKAFAENALLQVADPFAYALTDELMTLTNELGIFIDGYFIKQDIDWTEEDLANLTEHLQSWSIPVVIHKWEPSEEIVEAIEAGGATLVVLDNLELTAEPLTAGVRANITALINGFSE